MLIAEQQQLFVVASGVFVAMSVHCCSLVLCSKYIELLTAFSYVNVANNIPSKYQKRIDVMESYLVVFLFCYISILRFYMTITTKYITLVTLTIVHVAI